MSEHPMAEAIRQYRLYGAELLIAWALRVLPDGPERHEFATFLLSSWMGRLADEAKRRGL